MQATLLNDAKLEEAEEQAGDRLQGGVARHNQTGLEARDQGQDHLRSSCIKGGGGESSQQEDETFRCCDCCKAQVPRALVKSQVGLLVLRLAAWMHQGPCDL